MLAIQSFVSRFLGPLSLEELFLAGRAAFLVFCFVLAAFTFARWRRAAERHSAQASEQLTRVLERLETLETTLRQLEPRLSTLGEQVEASCKAASSGATAHNYPIAIRLARAGAQPEELVANCGLTRQEAELVARLHGRDTDAQSPARRTNARHSAAA
jgi:Protein of unknown function (DUF2802)